MPETSPVIPITPIPTPATGIASAIGDIALMVTKALPSTEQQLEAFKLRSPKFYARIMEHLYHEDFIFLRWHHKVDIDTRVDFVNMDLPESAIDELKKMLHEQLGR